MSPAVVSQTVGHEEVNLGSTLLDKVVGECPETVISVNDCNVRCLLDTGAQVSTLTESFYKQFLSRDVDLINVVHLVRLSGTQGLDVPLLGFVELDVFMLGQKFTQMGFLIVKDPVDTPVAERKRAVPGVIGSNVFRKMREVLLNKFGVDFLGQVSQLPDNSKWEPVLALYEENLVTNNARGSSRIRISGDKPILIPARSIKTSGGCSKTC